MDSVSYVPQAMKKRRWKKPKGKPKRPLSAYNLFFRHVRNSLIKDACENEKMSSAEIDDLLKSRRGRSRHGRRGHGKITFADLTRQVSSQWKSLPPSQRSFFSEKAKLDTQRYQQELKLWNQARQVEQESEKMTLIHNAEELKENQEISDSSESQEEEEDFSLEEFGNLRFFPPGLVSSTSDSSTYSTDKVQPSSLGSTPNAADFPFTKNESSLSDLLHEAGLLDLLGSFQQEPLKITAESNPFNPQSHLQSLATSLDVDSTGWI